MTKLPLIPEEEGDRERERDRYIYIYIYIYTHMCVYTCLDKHRVASMVSHRVSYLVQVL